MIDLPSEHPVTYEAIKLNGRLYVREVETGKLVYSPPDFVRSRLPGREPMRELAEAMTKGLRYDINLVIDFEVKYGPKKRGAEAPL